MGLQVNGGTIATKNCLDNGYVAGDSWQWNNNIFNAGHTMNFGTVTLKEGENTIRIYGMDQNVLLQKLVLVSGDKNPLTSLTGPEQSYYTGMGKVSQQQVICYQAAETMFLPGTIIAKDCTDKGVTVADDMLVAVSGTEYVYEVNVTTDAQYVFSVEGLSASGATVAVQVDDTEALSFTLAAKENVVENNKAVNLTSGKHVIKVTVSADAKIRSVMAEIYDDTKGRPLKAEGTGGDAANAYKAADRKASSAWQPTEKNPTFTLDFGETVYADYFSLTGDMTGVTGFRLETSEDGENWTTAEVIRVSHFT